MTTTRTSAVDRLQVLPDVFRGADLTVRFQWTTKTASQYLYLWKKRSLVDALGGHSDVYVNLLAGKSAKWEAALQLATPSATLIGVEALRRAGWTTQIQRSPAVAVSPKDTLFKIDRFDLQPRPASWFAKVSKGIVRDGGTLPRLAPAWALADMLRESAWGRCGLFPDDIEWSEVTQQDEDQWREASIRFGLPRRVRLLDLAEESR